MGVMRTGGNHPGPLWYRIWIPFSVYQEASEPSDCLQGSEMTLGSREKTDYRGQGESWGKEYTQEAIAVVQIKYNGDLH